MTSRIDHVLDPARARLRRLEAPQTPAALRRGAVLVHIRPQAQREQEGSVPAAPGDRTQRAGVALRSDERRASAPRRLRTIEVEWVVLCSQEDNFSLAAAALQDLGLHRATDVVGGYQALLAAGLVTAT